MGIKRKKKRKSKFENTLIVHETNQSHQVPAPKNTKTRCNDLRNMFKFSATKSWLC